MVLQANDLTFGLVVDEVNDTQEIVVKPLGRQVRGIPIFAGATIMGNGRVVLILDVPGLAVRANVLSDVRDGRAEESDAPIEAAPEQREALLLVAGPDGTRMAVPLLQITRLEEFSCCVDRDASAIARSCSTSATCCRSRIIGGRWLDSGRRRGSLRAATRRRTSGVGVFAERRRRSASWWTGFWTRSKPASPTFVRRPDPA